MPSTPSIAVENVSSAGDKRDHLSGRCREVSCNDDLISENYGCADAELFGIAKRLIRWVVGGERPVETDDDRP